ncbi:MAG: DUF6263 family protein [Myxococcota bacterium]
MTIRRMFVVLAALAVTGSASGCGKKEEPAPAKTEATKAPEPSKAPEAGKATEPAKAAEPTKTAEPGKVDGEPTKPAEAPKNEAPAEAKATVTGTKLLEAGADPKVEIRMKPTAGSTQAAMLTMTVDASMTVAGQDVPMKFPPFNMGVSTTIDEVREGGDTAFTFKVDSADVGESADVMPPVMTAMKGAIGKVVGMGGKSVIDAHGVVKEAKFDVPAGAPDEMKQVVDSFQQSLGQMSIPFPSEPVGVGAKWQSTMTLEQMNLKVEQVATYEIVSIDGNIIKLKFTTQLSAPPQAMHTPQMPAGVDAQLNKFSGSGMTEATYDTTKVLPVQTTGKNTMTMDMTVSQAGQKQDMGLKMSVDMKLEPK